MFLSGPFDSHNFPLWGFCATSFGKSSFAQPVVLPGGEEWKLCSTVTQPVFSPASWAKFRADFVGEVENGRALGSKGVTGAGTPF